MSKLVHFFLYTIVIVSEVICGPKVKINQGLLEGKQSITENGFVYNSYHGIPYAKPPVGSFRFQGPLPPESWNRTRIATKVGNACVSVESSDLKVIGDEDCLYLNVYTPCTSDVCEPKLPVLFHIHGGGLIAGSGDTVRNAPDWIVERDIVVVTINYRLGLFGFLSLDIEEAPGNAGLKDQVAALRWVNENIASFGGDPNNVTISGVSAGAVSVNYLYLTNNAKGLFHRAIQMSGSALNPWAYHEDPKENAYKLCRALGHEPADDKDAYNFLITIPAADLILATGIPPISTISSDENLQLRNMIFLPTKEKVFPNQESFLTKSPLEVFQSGDFQQIPLYIGYCDGEGILGVPDARNDPIGFGLMNIDFERYVPKELCLKKNSNESLQVANKIKQFYYPNVPSTDGNFMNYINIKGDTWFKRGVNKAVQLLTTNSDAEVYYYVFTFDGYSDFKIILNTTHFKKAMHANDENYIFYSKNFPKEDVDCKLVHLRVLSMVENFIKSGNPTPQTSELIPVKWLSVTDKHKANDSHVGSKELHLAQ
ncbi:esterase FE4-like [Ctenocephalides felis]|uniref:esterase FE4-like n=1 Tax=Ctenocephalides felis TaxID=7515 RepID=UPI000E6E4D95|nr:esterase FE4-like [Ctenocephalides felis]